MQCKWMLDFIVFPAESAATSSSQAKHSCRVDSDSVPGGCYLADIQPAFCAS